MTLKDLPQDRFGAPSGLCLCETAVGQRQFMQLQATGPSLALSSSLFQGPPGLLKASKLNHLRA